MARPKKKIPAYCKHTPTGQGFVKLDGHRRYLGRHDDPATKRAYDAVIAEWLAAGRRLPVPAHELTVAELMNAYRKHAESYYRQPDGTPTSQVANVKLISKQVMALYEDSKVVDFGTSALRAVRERMIGNGWSRGMVNRSVAMIRMMFRWGVSRDMVPVSVHTALATVEPLRRGRCEAHETDPIRPVPQEHIDAVLKHVSRQVAALIRLQLLTAARAGELVTMRPVDLDTSGGEIWLYRPAAHKTAWHGHERTIYVGPQGQAVIKPFLAGRAVDAPMFSPREAEAERYAACKTHRHQDVEPAATDRELGDAYDTDSYRRCIHRACCKAGVPKWGVHRLRHNCGTALRKEFGLEAARIILGHRSPAVTTLYAEIDEGKAIDVMKRIG